jgi:anti-sigma regulatory factor (Ser/Thr protein kinase)
MAAALSLMEVATSTQISIDQLFDCAMAQQTARQIASGLGFGEQASEEIVLVVAELTSNLVKHAGCGAITLRPLNDGEKIGIEVETEDHGPGMRDVEEAFKDGYSTGGGLGYGLGTVNRLVDELEVSSTAALGTRILCRRWLGAKAEMAMVHDWQVGVATRPRRLAAANGDAFVIHEWNGRLLAGVIDGLGHGEPAQEAALSRTIVCPIPLRLRVRPNFLRGRPGMPRYSWRCNGLSPVRFANGHDIGQSR